MIGQPATAEAYQLLHEGSIALARVEAAGMRIDTDYLKSKIRETEEAIRQHQEDLKQDKVYKTWRRVFGDRMNLDSRSQLGQVLFGEMGYKSTSKTATERDKVDEDALERLDIPFAKSYVRIAKLQKTKSTFMQGVLNEVDAEGYAHCNYNLNIARSYRSSCNEFNFQNLPVRDPEMSALIRPAFIPREGHCIVEADYSGIEVRIAACYHKDPRMIDYIVNSPPLDMHRDMAAQIYCLKPSEVEKPVRHCAKNMYVFPQFYGDYYLNCAKQMWDALDRMSLMDGNGGSLKEHLLQKFPNGGGDFDPEAKSPRPRTFEAHMKEVENDFWNNRFKHYGKWKKSYYEQYVRRGWFDMHTGFVCRGYHDRKAVLNYATQGSAFHCMLQSLILVSNWLTRKKMKSKVIGQIHDSIVADVHLSELQDYLWKVKDVMTRKVPARWEWICVPLQVEAEVAPVGASWHQKKAYVDNNGVWSLAN